MASDGSIINNFRSVYEAAVEKGQRAENILYVPTYTPEVLQAAEQCIAEQRKYSSLSGITKTAIILSSGEEAANQLYLDGRRIPVDVTQTLHDMILRVNNTVEAQGYITKHALLKATGDYMIRHSGYRRKAERERVRRDVELVWDKYKRTVLTESDMDYRKPSADEKRRFGLTDDRWIITIPRNAQ